MFQNFWFWCRWFCVVLPVFWGAWRVIRLQTGWQFKSFLQKLIEKRFLPKVLKMLQFAGILAFSGHKYQKYPRIACSNEDGLLLKIDEQFQDLEHKIVSNKPPLLFLSARSGNFLPVCWWMLLGVYLCYHLLSSGSCHFPSVNNFWTHIFWYPSGHPNTQLFISHTNME